MKQRLLLDGEAVAVCLINRPFLSACVMWVWAHSAVRAAAPPSFLSGCWRLRQFPPLDHHTLFVPAELCQHLCQSTGGRGGGAGVTSDGREGTGALCGAKMLGVCGDTSWGSLVCTKVEDVSGWSLALPGSSWPVAHTLCFIFLSNEYKPSSQRNWESIMVDASKAVGAAHSSRRWEEQGIPRQLAVSCSNSGLVVSSAQTCCCWRGRAAVLSHPLLGPPPLHSYCRQCLCKRVEPTVLQKHWSDIQLIDMIAYISRRTSRSVGRGEDGAEANGAVGRSGGPFPYESPFGSVTQRLSVVRVYPLRSRFAHVVGLRTLQNSSALTRTACLMVTWNLVLYHFFTEFFFSKCTWRYCGSWPELPWKWLGSNLKTYINVYIIKAVLLQLFESEV